jgi:hypothetical protein
MRACRPSWCASGHRQPVRRTMNGAPSAVWSSRWPHGVGRRSKGSSISSISFAAASRRPRRSCQRSSTRSDQDRPTPPPAGPLPGSGPAGSMQVYESIWTWLGHAAGMAVPAWSGPAHLLGKWVLQPGRSVRDPFGLAMAEQAGLDRAAIAWRSASAGVSDQRRPEAEVLPGGVRILASSRDRSTSLGGPRQPAAVTVLGR